MKANFFTTLYKCTCGMISSEVGLASKYTWRNPIVYVNLLWGHSNRNSDFQGHGDVTCSDIVDKGW